MIGVLMFLNSRGDIVLSRIFRDGYVVRRLAESFRNQLISTNMADRSPINIVDNLCYVHVRFEDLYLVVVSDGNVNCFTCFQYLLHLLDIFHAYFKAVDEVTLKENFVTLHQIVDETMDFGYPQITGVRLLKSFIHPKGLDIALMKRPSESERVTQRLTGEMPLRNKNIWYRANEIFVEVNEELFVLVSRTGQVLENNVAGCVVVKSFLSGMPECQLVLGDRFNVHDGSYHSSARVKADGTITFVPLDGVFLLMRYCTVLTSPPPVKILHTRLRELSKTRTEIEFGLKCEMAEGAQCNDVEIRIPCPENTADVSVAVTRGEARFDGILHAVVWKLSSVSHSDEEMSFSAGIVRIAPTLATAEHVWSRPPIKISFTTRSHVLSGFQVKELRVEEPVLRYTPSKWIRYTTRAGQYEWRL